MGSLNGFDVALLVLSAVLGLVGVIKGLTRLLIGVGALVAAFVLAARFHERLASAVAPGVPLAGPALKLAAYLAIFLATMIAGGLVAWLVRKLLRAAMLSWLDRLAGAAVGVVAAALAAALILLPVVAYAPAGESVLRESVLAPYVTVVADLAGRLAPAAMSERYQAKVESLRRYWRERWAAAGARAV